LRDGNASIAEKLLLKKKKQLNTIHSAYFINNKKQKTAAKFL
jgi:hypothetical protein